MKFTNSLWILVSALFFAGCQNHGEKTEQGKNQSHFEVVYQKTFGLTKITMCLVTDTSEIALKSIGDKIIKDDRISFIFFYSDKGKIKDINQFTNALDAIPSDGYIAEYSTENGFHKNVNRYVVKKPTGKLQIIFLEKKSKLGKYLWYSYYVKNYSDTKETDDKMIGIAKKVPVVSDGYTEVFFFNDKINAPKLTNDGWGKDESQNSWNEKYGKYCVGYYSIGSGEEGEFSKGWK